MRDGFEGGNRVKTERCSLSGGCASLRAHLRRRHLDVDARLQPLRRLRFIEGLGLLSMPEPLDVAASPEAALH